VGDRAGVFALTLAPMMGEQDPAPSLREPVRIGHLSDREHVQPDQRRRGGADTREAGCGHETATPQPGHGDNATAHRQAIRAPRASTRRVLSYANRTSVCKQL
jgi:hypothetical protein